MEEKDGLITTSLARSRIYRFLSAAFLYPDEKFLSLLKDGVFDTIKESIELLSPKKNIYLIEPLNFLKEYSKNLSFSVLEKEFTSIFGHAISRECPPNETQYGNENVFQQTQQMADIAGFYRAFGLEVADNTKESFDHISIESEFMYFLAYKEAYARSHHGEEEIKICIEGEKRFLKEHMGRWVPVFTQLLKKLKKVDKGFYKELAVFTENFITFELEYLKVKPEKLINIILPHPESGDASCEGCMSQ